MIYMIRYDVCLNFFYATYLERGRYIGTSCSPISVPVTSSILQLLSNGWVEFDDIFTQFLIHYAIVHLIHFCICCILFFFSIWMTVTHGLCHWLTRRYNLLIHNSSKTAEWNSIKKFTHSLSHDAIVHLLFCFSIWMTFGVSFHLFSMWESRFHFVSNAHSFF